MQYLKNCYQKLVETIAFHQGARASLKHALSTNQDKIRVLERDLVNTELAQTIMQQVAQRTQEEITFHIADVVSTALEAVFPDPYTFKIDFVIKRGKTEANLYFERDGLRCNPIQESGGGVVDIAAFALRIALWSLQRPGSNNTIVLDEPMKFLSRELQPKAGEMLKLLSEKLGIQFIIVTHDTAFQDCADRVFFVEKKGGISHVTAGE